MTATVRSFTWTVDVFSNDAGSKAGNVTNLLIHVSKRVATG